MSTFQVSDELMQQAKEAHDSANEQEILEDALRLWIRLQKQGKVIQSLQGIATWEGNLQESRTSRFAE